LWKQFILNLIFYCTGFLFKRLVFQDIHNVWLFEKYIKLSTI